MKSKKSLGSSLRWISAVSGRFSSIDRKGRSAVTSFLATLGICFGVMTLITVVSVMNGFQQYSINPIMEISSNHLRVTDIPEDQLFDFIDYCDESKRFDCALPFFESQGLMVGNRNRQAAAVIRAVDPEIMEKDQGFKSQVKIIFGKFDLNYPEGIVLGQTLANHLGVTVGSTVNLMAMSGGKDVALVSQNRQFTVTGLFDCSYSDIEQSYGFVSLSSAEKYFGQSAEMIYGIKLKNYENDIGAVAEINEKFPDVKVQSWREFNKSFFAALRIEKNILMILVCIIFVVVGINIYNGMRRLVFERRQEISILSALGGTKKEIKSIFIMRGFTSGASGSFAGLILGLLICVNIKPIFEFMAMITGNTMFSIFANIPARIMLNEVFMITMFGIIAPLWASLVASNNVLNMKVAEVLHDE